MGKLRFIFLLIIGALMSFGSFAQEDENSKNILRLLRSNGSAETYKAAIQEMLTMYKEQGIVPDNLFAEIQKEFTSEATMNELLLEIVPIYKKHFTPAEIKELLVFYDSPIGKKLSRESSAMTTEAMEAAQTLGTRIGIKIMTKMGQK